jgi:YbbR domain-containing protein
VSVLPQVVTRNWRLKLSAFILSVFLWAIVSLEPRNREVIPTVPVEVVLNDPEWTLADAPSPMTVSVHLGGVAQDLFGLTLARATLVEVPVDRVTGTDTVIRLRPEWVQLSGGSNVVVQSITPAAVALRFEPTLSAAVPLSLRTRNQLPAGLALAQPLTLTPMVATVRGPARALERLDSLPLLPLDLSDLRRSGTYHVQIDSSALEGLAFQPAGAQIAVNLQPEAERVLSDVPVLVEPPAGVDSASLVARPATVQVTLRGARTLLEGAAAFGVVAFVAARDLEGIAAGNEWSVPIRLRGISSLLQGRAGVDSVRVLRAPTPATLAEPSTDSGVPRDPTAPPDTAPRGTAAPRDTTTPRGGGGRGDTLAPTVRTPGGGPSGRPRPVLPGGGSRR